MKSANHVLLWRIVAMLLLGSAPYAYAWWSSPADQAFMGLMADVPDHAQYWAWVTQSEGALFISNTLTPEPNHPVFLNAWMFLLAQVRRLTGVSFPLLFQLWRIVSTIILVSGIHAFSRTVVRDRRLQSTVFWLALVGSGFGWTLVVAKKLMGLGDVPFPNDVFLFETNSFFAAFAYPYVALAQGLIVWTFVGFLWSLAGDLRKGATTAIVAALGVAAFHAYDLITVYSVLCVYVAIEVIRTRSLPWRLIGTTAAIGFLTAPIAIYYRLLTLNDPLWQAILAQYENAGVVTPPGVHFIILLGLPLLLAPFGLARLEGEPLPRFIPVWAAVGAIICFFPTVYQVKLLTALQFPLAVLAARAWQRWTSADTSPVPAMARRAAGFAPAALVLLALPTNVYLYAWRFIDLARHERPYFLQRDELRALEWIATHATPADVVLAPLDIGQFVPSYGRGRAYLAHWAMTNRFFERSARVEQFFNPAQEPDVRRQVLDADQVTLVVATRHEALGNGGEPPPGWLTPVYVAGNVRVFQYTPPAAAETRAANGPSASGSLPSSGDVKP